MATVHAHKGSVVNIYEQDLPLETRDRRLTVVLTDREHEAVKADAVSLGYAPDRFGAHARYLMLLGLRVRKKMNLTVEEILR